MCTCSRRSTARGWIALAITAASALAVLPGGTAAALEKARPEAPASELVVGARLEALANVKVARAELAKGARVSVAGLVERQGRLTAVDVELADGYVARVAVATIRKSFRLLADE